MGAASIPTPAHQRVAQGILDLASLNEDERNGWRVNAKCLGRGDVFFSAGDNKKGAAVAAKLCAECPVRMPCTVDYCASHKPEVGFRFGMSERNAKTFRNVVRRILKPSKPEAA